MEQEDKKLLLQDLCARLPYGLKVHYKTAVWEVIKHPFVWFYNKCNEKFRKT